MNVGQFMDRPNPRFPRSNLEAKEWKGQSQSQSQKESKEKTIENSKKKMKMMWISHDANLQIWFKKQNGISYAS